MKCQKKLLNLCFALSLLVISIGCNGRSGNLKSAVNPSSEPTSPPMAVNIALKEWSITADKGVAPSGRITFLAVNHGARRITSW